MTLNSFIENQNIINTVISIAVLCLFLLLRKLFSKYLFKLVLWFTKKTSADFLTNLWLSFEHPIRWLFVVIGFYIAAQYFPYLDANNLLFLRLYRSVIVIFITWGLYNLSSSSSVMFRNFSNRFNLEIDQILIPFLSKALRLIIIAISIGIIADEFGFNINGLMAGLGLGSLAVALAAQDALKNLFGGVVIIFEKPFSIGDWILTPSVEGTVEDITFRSTKIRTFAQALVTVPNSTLANESITNWSKMGKRKIEFRLGLEYGTPTQKLENCVSQIRNLVVNHSGIHKETIHVTFDSFAESSLQLFLYFFTNTTVWSEFLLVKQEINLQILKILEAEGVRIALPTQFIYLNNRADQS